MIGSDFITGGVLIACVLSGLAAFMFGRAAWEQLWHGSRKRALFFGVIAALATPVTFHLFRFFVQRTYGSF